jgi:hypothetical protein
LNIIDILDRKAKIAPLCASERASLGDSNDNPAKLRCDEESKWTQRAKVKHVQEGAIIQSTFTLVMANIGGNFPPIRTRCGYDRW